MTSINQHEKEVFEYLLFREAAELERMADSHVNNGSYEQLRKDLRRIATERRALAYELRNR